MYTREQIIEEIKRITRNKEGKLPSETDFEHQSTIPLSTLRFHLGSWQRALEESGLISHLNGKQKKKEEPKSDDELLLELLRLHKDSGELPTTALVQAKGKYSDRHYKNRWKSLAQAFQIAKNKFGSKKPPTSIQDIPPLGKSIPLEKTNKEEIEAKYMLDEPVEPQKTMESQTASTPTEPVQPPPLLEPYAEPMEKKGGEEEMEHFNNNTPKIKFIPKTIKPQKTEKPKVPLESIDFRGLRFAPVTKTGVAYLLGMISHELGYIVESIISDYPECEGKRCIDQETNQWERIKIQLEYKSSNVKTTSNTDGFNSKNCDLIVCWKHDWPECPFEVLELQSILKHLT